MSVSINDFSTLYTHALHDKLIKILKSVIDFAFKNWAQNKIPINNYDITSWCKFSKYFVFDINSLKKQLNFLLGIVALLLEITFFNKQLVLLWDQTQNHFSLIFFYSIKNDNT